MPSRPTDYKDLTVIQKAFIETLTDERVRSITLAADVFGDMDADTLALIRNPKPELIKYLSELRDDEIKELMNAIELVRASRRIGRLARASAIALSSTFLGTILLWDKVSPWITAIFQK